MEVLQETGVECIRATTGTQGMSIHRGGTASLWGTAVTTPAAQWTIEMETRNFCTVLAGTEFLEFAEHLDAIVRYLRAFRAGSDSEALRVLFLSQDTYPMQTIEGRRGPRTVSTPMTVQGAPALAAFVHFEPSLALVWPKEK